MPTDPGGPTEPPPPPPTGPPPVELVAYFVAWRDSLPATSWWRPLFDLIIQAMTSSGGGS